MLPSGTSRLPKLLAAPAPLLLTEAPEIKGLYCYVTRGYGRSGLSALICRQPLQAPKGNGVRDFGVYVVVGDWTGRVFDLSKTGSDTMLALRFMNDFAGRFSEVMKLVGIHQAQFYFAIVNDEMVLVDIQTAVDKLCGPGLIRDIFGKIVKTQEVLKVEPIDERALAAIAAGDGSYQGNLLIKPSRFRAVERPGGSRPLYVEVIR